MILKKKENPVSSFTLELSDKSKLIMTGGNVVRDFHLIIFKVK